MVSARAIAIIGQSAPETGPAAADAEACGRLLARQGVTVVTGGLGGVMAAASRGAREEGGLVIAVLPGIERDAVRAAADAVVCTGSGEGRNLAVVASGDGAIAIGGGWGTLSEIGLARRIGRPVVMLGTWGVCPPAGWDPGGLPPVAETPEGAVAAVMAAI